MGQFKKLLVEALIKEGYRVQPYKPSITWYYCSNPDYALAITRLQLCIYLKGEVVGALFRTGHKEEFVKEAMVFVRFYAGPPAEKNEGIN
jgi:hypothetical protein